MSAVGLIAFASLTALVACVLLATIPYGAEEPALRSPDDASVRNHRHYLLSRGWAVDERLESAPPGAPVPCAPWSRREDGLGPHTFADALLLQLTEDVERLGGYDPFVSLCDLSEKGVER